MDALTPSKVLPVPPAGLVFPKQGAVPVGRKVYVHSVAILVPATAILDALALLACSPPSLPLHSRAELSRESSAFSFSLFVQAVQSNARL